MDVIPRCNISNLYGWIRHCHHNLPHNTATAQVRRRRRSTRNNNNGHRATAVRSLALLGSNDEALRTQALMELTKLKNGVCVCVCVLRYNHHYRDRHGDLLDSLMNERMKHTRSDQHKMYSTLWYVILSKLFLSSEVSLQ